MTPAAPPPAIPALPIDETCRASARFWRSPAAWCWSRRPARARRRVFRWLCWTHCAPWRGDGKIIVLEPRRLAARAAADAHGGLLGESLGETVGLKVRLQSLGRPKTRIEVVTEGVFARMILDDPSLEGVAAVLFDEFHERSLDADLGLALALDAQAALRAGPAPCRRCRRRSTAPASPA